MSTSTASAKKPLIYQEIAKELREHIASGRYQPDTKLPSLYELTAEFNVSTISVRRALKELTSEGLIYGEQGRGVFVRPKAVIHRVLPADSNSSTGDEIARAGFLPRILEVSSEIVSASEDIAQRLNVKPGTRIYCHRKMVFADSQPVSFHTLYFPRKIVNRLKSKLHTMFIFQVLHEVDISVEKTKFEFGATALASEHIDLFRLPVGYPMGVVYFTPLDKAGAPILVGVTLYRSDRFLYEMTSAMS